MAIKTRSELFNRFKTDDFPTQQDFTDWRDSFFHVTEDTIPVVTIDGTTTAYNSDVEAVAGGLGLHEMYLAGSAHTGGVRQGTPCRVNSI